MAYYGTQGGGIAVMDPSGELLWREPPSGFPEMQPGDKVPTEWDTVGPFDDETNQL